MMISAVYFGLQKGKQWVLGTESIPQRKGRISSTFGFYNFIVLQAELTIFIRESYRRYLCVIEGSVENGLREQ